MTVAKATITGPLLDATGAPAVGTTVVARLISVASGGHTTDGELVQPVSVITDSAGQFSLALPLNTAIQPAGTFYRVTAGRTVWSIVLTSTGTFHVGDLALAVLSPEPPGWVPVESSGGHSSGTGVQKGDGSGGFAAAVAGTDFDAAGAAAAVAAALGTAATHPASDFDATGAAAAVQALAALRANNLSDLASASASRTNLGLGTAATQATGAFDAAGAATAVQALAALRANNLSDLASASTARTNLGLGTAATSASTAFEVAGAAAAAQAASQPLDAELTALAALVSAADRAPYFTGSGAAALAILTAFARTLLDDADAATMRTTLGLGTAATQATNVFAQVANNLSDVTAGTARTNLGLGTSATHPTGDFAQTANNLSDVTAATARTNLGLGSAATHPASDFVGPTSGSAVQKADGLGGLTAAASGTDYAGPGAITPWTLQSGRYYRFPKIGTLSTAMATTANMRLTPYWLASPVTLSRLGAEVTTSGDVGSKVRLGIYADDGAGRPGALIIDAGTIAGDSVSVQEITISQALSRGWVWFAAVTQLVTTTQPNMRTVTQFFEAVDVGASAPAGNNICGLSMTGVTGALPGTFSLTGTSSLSVAMFGKVA